MPNGLPAGCPPVERQAQDLALEAGEILDRCSLCPFHRAVRQATGAVARRDVEVTVGAEQDPSADMAGDIGVTEQHGQAQLARGGSYA